jgi:hypothetical protein
MGADSSLTYTVAQLETLTQVLYYAGQAQGAITGLVKETTIPVDEWPQFADSARSAYSTAQALMEFTSTDLAKLFNNTTDAILKVCNNYLATENATERAATSIEAQGASKSISNDFDYIDYIIATASKSPSENESAAKATSLGEGGILLTPSLVDAGVQIARFMKFKSLGSGFIGNPVGGLAFVAIIGAVAPNLKSAQPFTHAATIWGAVSKSANELGGRIATCFPITGWTGAASKNFQNFVIGTALPAITEFARLASELAGLFTYIANVLHNFLIGVGLASAAGTTELLTLGRLPAVWAQAAVWISIAGYFAAVELAVHNSSDSISGHLRKQIIPDEETLHGMVSTSSDRLAGNLLEVAFEMAMYRNTPTSRNPTLPPSTPPLSSPPSK